MPDVLVLTRRLSTVVRDTFASPGEDPAVTMAVVAIMAVVAMLVAVGILMAYNSTRPPAPQRSVRIVVSHSRRAGARFAVSIAWALLTVVVVVGVAVGLRAANAPSTCSRCHGSYAEALEGSSHAGVGCSECHMRPGITGAVERQFAYAREVTVYALRARNPQLDTPHGQEEVADVVLNLPGPASSSCLRCHRSLTDGVVSSAGIRMEHAHVLREGGRCPDCHTGVAHPGVVSRVRLSRMEECVLCHDSRKASAECSFCHEGDIGLVSRVSRSRPSPDLDIGASSDCRGCHSEELQQECIACHGLELPHPVEWVAERTHARPGFVERDNCLRCHDELRYCNRCHRFPSLHQPTSRWVGLHGAAATGRASVPYNISSCVFSECHSDTFCDMCHEDRNRGRTPPLLRQPCHASAGSARDELVLIPLDSACH